MKIYKWHFRCCYLPLQREALYLNISFPHVILIILGYPEPVEVVSAPSPQPPSSSTDRTLSG
jgi:hypothetical protein